MAIERLTSIGWGLSLFAIIVGIGLVVLQKFGDTVVRCGDADKVWNATVQLCGNATAYTAATGAETGVGPSYTAIAYVATQMGSTGLASWIPVVIVVLIAGLVLALFGGRGKNY